MVSTVSLVLCASTFAPRVVLRNSFSFCSFVIESLRERRYSIRYFICSSIMPKKFTAGAFCISSFVLLNSRPIDGHGAIVWPRSRNSIDYVVGVNSPKDWPGNAECTNITGDACYNGQADFWCAILTLFPERLRNMCYILFFLGSLCVSQISFCFTDFRCDLNKIIAHCTQQNFLDYYHRVCSFIHRYSQGCFIGCSECDHSMFLSLNFGSVKFSSLLSKYNNDHNCLK